jgi:transcriptional regulator with XRE-family HTH domain
MDRRRLAALFRERLHGLVARSGGSLAAFARETGVDRSALSQFLDAGSDRLPRAETLRAIAAGKGVTVDWLLGLANSAEGGQEIARSSEIETAVYADGGNPLDRWRREALGAKIRYVPTTIPDMLRLPEVMLYELEGPRAAARLEHGESVMDDALLGELDLEIALPLQALEEFAVGGGIWRHLAPEIRRRQLDHMRARAAESYPRLRLHLYDGRRTYSAPFTVFGLFRVAIYFGDQYLVLTAADQVRAFANHFDRLVRDATVEARDTPEVLAEYLAMVDAAPARSPLAAPEPG